MPSSFFSDFSRTNSGTAPAPLASSAPWQTYRQQQQQPNQGPAGSPAPLAAELDPLDEGDGGTGDDSFDTAPPQDSSSGSSDNDDPPAAASSSAEPLRAERRRSNQLEKELRGVRQQLTRFSEINPEEYSRLQDAERKREEFERQVGERERQLNEAKIRRVRSVEKERDEARSQVQNLRKERLLGRLFSEAEGRVGGDERGTFFDTFAVDGKGQPLTADDVALCDSDYMEELRRHPVFSFLFQQRSGLYAGTVAEAGHDHSAAPTPRTLA